MPESSARIAKVMAFATQDASPTERDNARLWLKERGLWPPPEKPKARGFTPPSGQEPWSIEWKASDLAEGVTTPELITAARRHAQRDGFVDLDGIIIRSRHDVLTGITWVRVSGLVRRRPFGEATQDRRDFEAELNAWEQTIVNDAEKIRRQSEALRQQTEAAEAAAKKYRTEEPAPGTKARTSFLGRERGTRLDDVLDELRTGTSFLGRRPKP